MAIYDVFLLCIFLSPSKVKRSHYWYKDEEQVEILRNVTLVRNSDRLFELLLNLITTGTDSKVTVELLNLITRVRMETYHRFC